MVTKIRMNKNIFPCLILVQQTTDSSYKMWTAARVWEEVQELTSSFNSVLSSQTNYWTLMWFFLQTETDGRRSQLKNSTGDWNQLTCKWSTSIWKAGAEQTDAGRPEPSRTKNWRHILYFYILSADTETLPGPVNNVRKKINQHKM